MEDEIMKKIIVFGFIIILIFITGCVVPISNFEECVNAGNPVLESYPRKCVANNEVFIEVTSEPLVGGCGTVTPGYNDECCANVNKNVPHASCVGEWKWIASTGRCKFVCTTQEIIDEREQKLLTAKPVKYNEFSEKQKHIPCEQDSDCQFERIKALYSDPILPKCVTENFCREGICVYNCII